MQTRASDGVVSEVGNALRGDERAHEVIFRSELCDVSDGGHIFSLRGCRASIPEKWPEEEVCVHYGFCRHEYDAICSQLNRSGRCKVYRRLEL